MLSLHGPAEKQLSQLLFSLYAGFRPLQAIEDFL